jgi:hypothetical protein
MDMSDSEEMQYLDELPDCDEKSGKFSLYYMLLEINHEYRVCKKKEILAPIPGFFFFWGGGFFRSGTLGCSSDSLLGRWGGARPPSDNVATVGW